MTCKLQAYISVYQEGLKTEFCVPSYNSDLAEMIEERADDEMVKKSLKEMKYFYQIIEEDQKIIKLKILHDS